MRSKVRWLRLLAGFALILSGAARDASPETGPPANAAVVEGFRRGLHDLLARQHWSAESIDFEGLMREIEQRVAAGASPAAIDAWLRPEIAARYLAFAPIRESANPTPFLLPFDRRIHWIVGQGVSTQGTHQGWEEYALDFAMPEGTPILAVRRGTVARVVDGFTQCCLPPERASETNRVTVLHPNGTFSDYGHLRPGIRVKEGQSVKAGDLLAFSGSTGYAMTPHLHFSVSIRKSATEAQTIPIRFWNGTPEGYLPEPWRLYENRPAATAQLRVSVGGTGLVSGEPFLLPDRSPVQLKVVLEADPPGQDADVSQARGIRIVSLTPWSLQFDPSGRILFTSPPPAWAAVPDAMKRDAIASILYQTPDGREGYFDAWFRLPAVESAGTAQP